MDGHSFVAAGLPGAASSRSWKRPGRAWSADPCAWRRTRRSGARWSRRCTPRWAVGTVPYRTLRARAKVESLQTGSFRRERPGHRGALRRVAGGGRGPGHEHAHPQGRLQAAARSRHPLLVRAAAGACADCGGRSSRSGWSRPDPPEAPRHLQGKYVLPSALVLLAAGSLLSSLWWMAGGPVLPGCLGAAFLCAYAGLVAGFAVSRVRQLGTGAARLLAILPVLHVGYGLGFLARRGRTCPSRRGRMSDRHEAGCCWRSCASAGKRRRRCRPSGRTRSWSWRGPVTCTRPCTRASRARAASTSSATRAKEALARLRRQGPVGQPAPAGARRAGARRAGRRGDRPRRAQGPGHAPPLLRALRRAHPGRRGPARPASERLGDAVRALEARAGRRHRSGSARTGCAAASSCR